MNALRRLAGLTWTERLLLAEAALILPLAAACVAFVPFRVLGRFVTSDLREESAPPEETEMIRAVAWAVRAAALRSPLRARCFEQAVAAVWLLQRRRVANVLHYGLAKNANEKLVGHVWVTSRGREVIGCENKDEFHEFVCFPEVIERRPADGRKARTFRRFR